MEDQLFVKIYVDEDIHPLLAKFLRQQGFDAISAHEINATGLNDKDQLNLAIAQQRVLISYNKRNFLQDSKAEQNNHFGIILITTQRKTIKDLNKLTKEIINKYLN